MSTRDDLDCRWRIEREHLDALRAGAERERIGVEELVRLFLARYLPQSVAESIARLFEEVKT